MTTLSLLGIKGGNPGRKGLGERARGRKDGLTSTSWQNIPKRTIAFVSSRLRAAWEELPDLGLGQVIACVYT